MKIPRLAPLSLMLAGALTLTAACGAADDDSGSGGSDDGKYKIALNLSFTGNDWQDQAANLIKAAAASDNYKDKVDLQVDIAGPEVTKQIQTLNNEIAAGVDAIIVYPISPTALNSTIKKACEKDILVFAYDSLVSEPCAFNTHIDQYEHGKYNAEWLVKELGGKGTIANVTGVAGTTVDSDRLKALEDVLAENPGVKVAGAAPGDWTQSLGAQAFASIQSAHPDVDGVFAQAGCWAITEYQLKKNQEPLPCAGEYTNGHHIYMLPEELGGIGLRSSSAGSPVYSGELAFINAVRALDGEDVAKNIVLPLPHFNTDDVAKMGEDAFGTNPAEDGSVMLPPGTVKGGFFDGFWSPLVEQGYKAAQTGEPDTISTAKPCAEVEGCIEKDKLEFDDNHAGGN